MNSIISVDLKTLDLYLVTNNDNLFIGSSMGLYGHTFVDFGDNYKCLDKNGEDLPSKIVVNITKVNL